MTARALMVQGTASHVGKSFLVTGLCRLYAQQGVRVAPFKAQNMALNSFVTPDGGEIGRAQAVQAEAAMVAPHVDMNPILLKPTRDHVSQVIIHGRPVREMAAGAYWATGFEDAWAAVAASYGRLSAAYDLVLIEGAGSPAEMNLRQRDLSNMRVAELADCPVLLVGDIERGGVFAALLGTLGLLPDAERRRIGGLVVNKFRGDRALFCDGERYLAQRSGVPVLGVVPYSDIELPSEDSLSLPQGPDRERADVEVAVVRHPHISNFTDLDALRRTPGVSVRFTVNPREIMEADVVVLPGTKNAVGDLAFLRERGLADAVVVARQKGASVVGLCGGMQMLGHTLLDPEGLEGGSPGVHPGLGLLPIRTSFRRGKTTHQAQGRIAVAGSGWEGMEVTGYEVHSGESEILPQGQAFVRMERRSGQPVQALDGVYVDRGLFGTYFHGLFDVAEFRRAFLDDIRRSRGLRPLSEEEVAIADPGGRAFDAVAELLRRHLDLRQLERLTGIAL